MAKSKNSGKTKQDQIIANFSREIRSEENRTWLNATEQAVQDGKRFLKAPTPEPVRISYFDPKNPLNGSSSWSRQKWAEYNASLKAKKAAEKAEAKLNKESDQVEHA